MGLELSLHTGSVTHNIICKLTSVLDTLTDVLILKRFCMYEQEPVKYFDIFHLNTWTVVGKSASKAGAKHQATSVFVRVILL